MNLKNRSLFAYVLIAVLAIMLIISLIIGANAKTKTVYIPAPEFASDDFSGVILSDYDNLNLNFQYNYTSFEFAGFDVYQYDYVVLDVCNASFAASDLATVKFGPMIDGSSLREPVMSYNSISYDSSTKVTSYDGGGAFDFDKPADYKNHTFTYIFDLTSIQDNTLNIHLFLDGIYYNTLIDNEISSNIEITEFMISYGPILKSTDKYIVNGLYLYGFEDSDKCTIGDYFTEGADLSTCKDSMLYKGE